MAARDLYSVGARLLGLYLMVDGLVSFLGLGGTYEAARNGKDFHPLGYALVAGGQAILLSIIGLTLFLKNRISNVPSTTVSPTRAEFLLVGLQLLGVYFAVAGLVGTLHAVGHIVAVEESFAFHFTDIVTSLAYVCIGLFLVFRSSKVVRIIAT